MSVVVLSGGLSAERDVSLRSGRRLAEALRAEGEDVLVLDLDAALLPTLRSERPDVVIPLVHGAAGEDGSLADVLEAIEDFSIEGQEKVVMDWIAAKGYHTGNIMNAFRLTLVGEGKGPHMFDISWVLGKEETLSRIKRAVEILK